MYASLILFLEFSSWPLWRAFGSRKTNSRQKRGIVTPNYMLNKHYRGNPYVAAGSPRRVGRQGRGAAVQSLCRGLIGIKIRQEP